MYVYMLTWAFKIVAVGMRNPCYITTSLSYLELRELADINKATVHVYTTKSN